MPPDVVSAYTYYVRDCHLQPCIPPERVQVMPLGVNMARSAPMHPR